MVKYYEDTIACTLMHKQIPVLDVELDETTCAILKITAVHAPEHLPLSVSFLRDNVDRKALNAWWLERSIPASRSGVRQALEALQITSTRQLLLRCYGLSLSDQYWLLPQNKNITWEEVNFFTNPFADDIGDILFGLEHHANPLDFSSPDNTSDGNLKKRWKIIANKRCLVKGGSNPFRQQAFNEVVATKIMELLDIPHIPYSLVWNNGAPYSVCEDFIDENTELIPAWQIFNAYKRQNNHSTYEHFIKACANLDIPNVVSFLDKMLTIDYLLANEDRHLNNFGVIRNAVTLEWLGMAPIYDSGSSLGYDKLAAQILADKEIECKPFKTSHKEQLKLVSSFAWLDVKKLAEVEPNLREVLNPTATEGYMDAMRLEAIISAMQKRIAYLKTFIEQHHAPGTYSQDGDVQNDIAKKYK